MSFKGPGMPAFSIPVHLDILLNRVILKRLFASGPWGDFSLRACFTLLRGLSRAFSISADQMILQVLLPKEQQTSGMREVRSVNKRSNFHRYVCVAWLNRWYGE